MRNANGCPMMRNKYIGGPRARGDAENARACVVCHVNAGRSTECKIHSFSQSHKITINIYNKKQKLNNMKKHTALIMYIFDHVCRQCTVIIEITLL